jgi:hypothetical protein
VRAPVAKRTSYPTFGRSVSSEVGALPLATSGATPAGFHEPVTPAQGWTGFDEDDEEQLAIGQGSSKTDVLKTKGKERARDCWQSLLELAGLKERPLTGERTIWLNDPVRNSASKFKHNSVSTSKYNLVTFFPKFLYEQFSKYANLFFLFTACIQQIPNVSPTNQYTTIAPLSLVLLVAAIKEVQEDIVRPFVCCERIKLELAYRNGTSPIQSSTRAKPRCSSTALSSTSPGGISRSATSSASRATTRSRPILSSSARASPTACATSRRAIWMGACCWPLTLLSKFALV